MKNFNLSINRKTSLLLIILSLMTVEILWAKESRIALVIGNGNYQNISPLDNPPNDAKLISKTLRKLGFEVVEVIDSNQRQMKKFILQFGRALRNSENNTVGLFYYAGHGVQANGTNYLIPTQSNIQDEAEMEIEAVDSQWILSQMESAGNEVNIVILDACRNNPYKSKFRSATRGLKRIQSTAGTFIAYSTSPGNVAIDGNGLYSPYTKSLVQSMLVPNKPIELVFKSARRSVINKTDGKQVPWDSSSLIRDFYFSGKTTITNTQQVKQKSTEQLYWETIKNSDDIDIYRQFLRKFPNGKFYDLAEIRIIQIKKKQQSQVQKIERIQQPFSREPVKKQYTPEQLRAIELFNKS